LDCDYWTLSDEAEELLGDDFDRVDIWTGLDCIGSWLIKIVSGLLTILWRLCGFPAEAEENTFSFPVSSRFVWKEE